MSKAEIERKLLNVLLAQAVLAEIPRRKLVRGLSSWRRFDGDEYGVSDYDLMHKCGAAACFGGWVAVTPAFKELGVRVDKAAAGGPKLRGKTDYHEIADELFGLSTMFSPNYELDIPDRKVIEQRLRAAFDYLVGQL